jgi:hypothetical protein
MHDISVRTMIQILRNSNRRFTLPVLVLFAIVLFPCGIAARLTPEDLAAITETGLTPLTGEQEGEYPKRDYVVVETMRVKRGETVKFSAGSRVFFHPNARAIVNGALLFEGSEKLPVTIGKLPFTLLKLSSDRRAVFDSTTVFIYRNGELTMRHTIIADSTIRVRLTDSTSAMTLDKMTSAGNLFTFYDTTMYFPAKAVVACTRGPGDMNTPCIPVLPYASGNELPKKERTRPRLAPVVPVRITLGAGTIAAGAAWYYFNRKAATAHDNYLVEGVAKNPDPNALLQHRLDNNRSVFYRDLAAVAAACGAASFTVTFAFGGRAR